MIGNDIHPTTIVGIKRPPKHFIRAKAFSMRTSPLICPSTRAGSTNYRKCAGSVGSELDSAAEAKHTPFHRVLARTAQHHRRDGRETTEPDYGCRGSRRSMRGFAGQLGPEQVSAGHRSPSRARPCTAVKTRPGKSLVLPCELQFMAATGLRPADGRRLLRPKIAASMPAADHTTQWIDPERAST